MDPVRQTESQIIKMTNTRSTNRPVTQDDLYKLADELIKHQQDINETFNPSEYLKPDNMHKWLIETLDRIQAPTSNNGKTNKSI